MENQEDKYTNICLTKVYEYNDLPEKIATVAGEVEGIFYANMRIVG
jgi:hypothetical protein